MANVKITPQTVLLTSGQAATFTATDATGQAVEVDWNLTPVVGSFVVPATGTLAASIKASSAVYVAIPLVGSAQTVTVIAALPAGDVSGNATICLTPDAVVITPAKVDLRAGQSQEFVAIVAGAPANPALPPAPAPPQPAAGMPAVPAVLPAPAPPQPAAGMPAVPAVLPAPALPQPAAGMPAVPAVLPAPAPPQPAAGMPAVPAEPPAPPPPQPAAGMPAVPAEPPAPPPPQPPAGMPAVPAMPAAPPALPAPTEGVQWVLSPQIGQLDDQTGQYRAPAEITDSATITITATTKGSRKQASATINLVPPPWKGRGVNLLGAYLLVVFSLVYFLIALWPPSEPTTPVAAAADRRAAETVLQGKTDSLKEAAAAAKNSADISAQAQSAANGAPKDEAKAQAAKAAADKEKIDSETLRQAGIEVDRARGDLDQKRKIEGQVTDPCVHTALVNRINRDIDLLLLVLLGGALGSFLHTARSYSEFIGNRTIKSSWTWWYCLHPFIGAGLALVIYAAVRGGFMAISTGSNLKASDLNPFGVVSLAALVGMFSKAATTKLGEVFDTMFESAKAGESKDKLNPSQSSGQPAATAPSGSSGSGAAATTPAKPATT